MAIAKERKKRWSCWSCGRFIWTYATSPNYYCDHCDVAYKEFRRLDIPPRLMQYALDVKKILVTPIAGEGVAELVFIEHDKEHVPSPG